MALLISAILSVRTSPLDLSVLSRWLTPDSSSRSAAGSCLGPSVGRAFWTGLLTIFWTGELLPTLLTFITRLREPGRHARDSTLRPGDSIAVVTDVLAAVGIDLIDATFATTSRGKALPKSRLSSGRTSN